MATIEAQQTTMAPETITAIAERLGAAASALWANITATGPDGRRAAGAASRAIDYASAAIDDTAAGRLDAARAALTVAVDNMATAWRLEAAGAPPAPLSPTATKEDHCPDCGAGAAYFQPVVPRSGIWHCDSCDYGGRYPAA